MSQSTLALALLPLGLLVPAVAIIAAAGTACPTHGKEPLGAERATTLMLMLSVVFLAGALGLPADVLATGGLPGDDLRNWVRVDAITGVVLTLIAGLAFVVVRYSRPYLDGEPNLPRYRRWLMLTLAAVTSLVIANHLVPIVIAWLVTSICLHQLLTFYRRRVQATVAAHKKFIISRIADVALFGAVALLSIGGGDLSLDGLARAAEGGELPLTMEAAAVLIVLGAALRCAQLPFHGWLIGVMEAPTPISALLHAGVVNIAGLVLVRLSPWMQHAELAQTLLVLIGGTTAVLAALIMSTQTSVKVALAWSTSAQMGLMLLQCGLGLYGLALVHLVTHSLYKAYAFLSAGSTVERQRKASQLPAAAPASALAWVAATAVATLAVAAGVTTIAPHASPSHLVMAAVTALGIVPALVWWRRSGPMAVALVGVVVAGTLVLHQGVALAAAGVDASSASATGAALRASLAGGADLRAARRSGAARGRPAHAAGPLGDPVAQRGPVHRCALHPPHLPGVAALAARPAGAAHASARHACAAG
jgi:NAD(P)H-quinone oxidoreductase subunit 5